MGTDAVQLFDWDELNFAELAREMNATGAGLQPTINYEPFHEKPPLFIWLQAVSTSLLGSTAAAARLVNLLCGVVSFVCLWYLGRAHFQVGKAIWWPLCLAGSLLPALYFQSGIIDPWFNLFILLGLWRSLTQPRMTPGQIALSGLLLGLAVLTKGPAAGLIAGLCWLSLLVLRPADRWARAGQYLAVGLLSLLPALVWLTLLWRVDGGHFAREFLDYQLRLFFQEDAGHGGFPGYHVVVLLLGCFPAAWLGLASLWGRFGSAQPAQRESDRGMRVLFWVVLLLFSVVNTKIIHYSSLCYFPLAWFAARALTRDGYRGQWGRAINIGLTTTWGLYALASLALPCLIWYLGGDDFSALAFDPELQSRLRLNVRWPWFTLLPALVAAAGLAWQLRSRKRYDLNYPAHRQAWAAGHLALSSLFLAAGLSCFAPRIQRYTQGAPAAFFAGLAEEEVTVGTAYYKSYAHWYYAALPPGRYGGGCQDRQCRFHGPNRLPLYFASPMRVTEQVLREVPDAELLYQSGGFSFYRRPPVEEGG